MGQKRRGFVTVVTLEDAREAMNIAYQTFFGLAAIHAVMLVVLAALSEGDLTNLGNPILMVALAGLIRLRQSRTAAICLMTYALFAAYLTTMARVGMPLGGFLSGSNVMLAALAVYGAYKAVRGTFTYHSIVEKYSS